MLHGTTAERAGHGPPAGGHPPRVARTPTIRWPSGPAAVQVNRTAAERVSGTAAVRVSGTAAVRDGPAHVGYAASWRHGRAREPAHRYALRRADRCPGPHRLAAQDTGLSRRRHGFESRWGYSPPPRPGGAEVVAQGARRLTAKGAVSPANIR